MWSDFNDPFTFAFNDKLRKSYMQTIPPHLISVATLPCEVRMCPFAEVVSCENNGKLLF